MMIVGMLALQAKSQVYWLFDFRNVHRTTEMLDAIRKHIQRKARFPPLWNDYQYDTTPHLARSIPIEMSCTVVKPVVAVFTPNGIVHIKGYMLTFGKDAAILLFGYSNDPWN